MINKLCVSELFVLVFQGRGLLSWYSGGLAQWKCVSRVPGGRAWCKQLQIPLGGTVLLSETFSPEGQDDYDSIWLSSPPLFTELSQKSNQSLLFPQFRQNPVLTLPVSEFYLRHRLSFKTPTASDWGVDLHCSGRGAGVIRLLPFARSVPRKWSHNHTVAHSLWQYIKTFAL